MPTNAAAAETRRTLRVLIVDTNTEDVRCAREQLQQDGTFVPTVARGTEEAEQLLAAGLYDVALIAYELWADRDSPLVRYVREHRSEIAVVVLTGGDLDGERLPALKLGAHDFLSRQHLADRGELAARVFSAFDENRALRRRDTMVRWLEREARTDHLTGLYNRRAFDDRLRDACDAASQLETATTLILADVAGTRTVNEAHGHETGDDMIRRAAQGIGRCIRGMDFAARVAGDDFGIILENADLELGRLIARRIAHEVERLNTTDWGQLIPVTLTFGVATGRSVKPGQLFGAADQALTNNKTNRPLVAMFLPRNDSDGPSVA